MCGLAGVVDFGRSSSTRAQLASVEAMVEELRRRGPDDRQICEMENAVLGFARLSLVDFAEGGQPFFNEDRTVCLIANGEVYNHRELESRLRSRARMRTRSDCEVLLHLYLENGTKFLKRVRGMGAVAVVDLRSRRLILARDQFGIKPLFYTRTRDRLVFASEIKAMWRVAGVPRSVDWNAALTHPTVTAAPELDRAPVDSLFAGISVVPSGSIVQIDLATGVEYRERYYDLPSFDNSSTGFTSDELISDYVETLRESVHRCATTDASVGLFLSAGVDSAAVAAFAREVTDLETFTANTPGTMANGDAAGAREVADALGLTNHQILFEMNSVPSADDWLNLLWRVETPLCGPEQFYKYEMYRHARERFPSMKAMLLGQGSDEFNGGYSAPLADNRGWDGFEAHLSWMDTRRTQRERGRLGIWFEGAGGASMLAYDASRKDQSLYSQFVHAKSRDIEQYNCWHEDRTAASFGFEARIPFLDPRIVSLTAQIPTSARAEMLYDKHILRAGLVGLVPEAVRTRPKIAFYRGRGQSKTVRTFAAMLRQDDAYLIRAATSTDSARRHLSESGLFEYLDALEHGQGEIELLLRLINLGLLQMMLEGNGAPPEGTPGNEICLRCDGLDSDLSTCAASTTSLDGGDVLAWADDVLLTTTMATDRVFVCQGGQILYELDAIHDELQVALIRAIDGSSTLAEVAVRVNVSLADVTQGLAWAIEADLLAARGGDA